MPVRFILGPAGSGKTHHCLRELRACERAGRPAIYLVPEQFTYSADRELLSDPTLPGLRHVQVLSFSRLGYRLREEAGAPPGLAVSAAVRTMLLRAVLARLDPELLGAMAGLRGRQGLLDELGRFIAEVRAHGPVAFHEAARKVCEEQPDRVAAPRLRSLAAVFEAYDRALRDLGRTDPEEALAGLEVRIAQRREEIRGWTLLVDGFLSWTRREREILTALAVTGASLAIALCLEEEPRVPFAPVQRSWDRLRAAFARAGVTEEAPLLLARPEPGRGRFLAATLHRLERGLFRESGSGEPEPSAPGFPQNVPAVELRSARQPRQEVLLWARTLDRWLRLDDAPCAPQETAIILRELGPYRDLVREIFPRYGIPVFLDERRGLLAHPRVRFLLGALEVVLSGWRRDAVITFLRNPALEIPPAEIDLLENLSLEYGRDFEAWYAPSWEAYLPGRRARFVRGEDEAAPAEADEGESEEVEFGEEDEPAADSALGVASVEPRAKMMRLADGLRVRWLLPLRAWQETWTGRAPTGADLVAGLRDLRARLMPNTTADEADPEWSRLGDREVESLLDEAAGLWPGVPVEPEELARVLRQGCASARVGVTPQRLGQVTVAEIQRSRLHGIRRAIVGGLNDGVFPRTIGEDAVLGDRDRHALREVGLEFGPSAEEKQDEETYFTYIALTRASERLLLTWSRSGEQGEPREPSILIDEVRRALPGLEASPVPVDPEEAPPDELQTGGELGDRLVAHLAESAILAEPLPASGEESAGTDEPEAGSAIDPRDDLLEELFLRVEGPEAPASDSPLSAIRARVDRARSALLHSPDLRLEEELVARLFPDDVIRAGVSRLLELAHCPYQSFARRVLRLEPRPRAEVTPLETGNLAHAALEAFFAAPTGPEADAVRARLERIFRDLERREEFRAFQVDAASRYRWRSTLQNLERFLRVELRRLDRSAYRPEAQEVSFGPAWGNAVEIALPENRRLLLVGRIDRLDRRTAGEQNYGAVIDYKRTARSGLPATLEQGLDLQLAAYLLFVREQLRWIPAGGFYAPVLVPPKRAEEAASPAGDPNPLKVKVHGIYLRDEGEGLDADTGMLPGVQKRSGQALETQEMDRLLRTGRRYLAAYATGLRSGWIEARPLEEKAGVLPCANCDFGAVCRHRAGQDPVRHAPIEGLAAGEATT